MAGTTTGSSERPRGRARPRGGPAATPERRSAWTPRSAAATARGGSSEVDRNEGERLMHKKNIEKLLELIVIAVSDKGSWQEKRQAVLDEAGDEDVTALEEFAEWFSREEQGR